MISFPCFKKKSTTPQTCKTLEPIPVKVPNLLSGPDLTHPFTLHTERTAFLCFYHPGYLLLGDVFILYCVCPLYLFKAPGQQRPSFPLFSSIKNIELPQKLRGKEFTCSCRRHRFDPSVGKIPWRREWPPTPVFLPRKSHGQRSLEGYSPRGCKQLDTMQRLNNNKR